MYVINLKSIKNNKITLINYLKTKMKNMEYIFIINIIKLNKLSNYKNIEIELSK